MEQSSYTKLFNAITDAIELLQKAQQECEEQFIKEKDNEPSKNKRKE